MRLRSFLALWVLMAVNLFGSSYLDAVTWSPVTTLGEPISSLEASSVVASNAVNQTVAAWSFSINNNNGMQSATLSPPSNVWTPVSIDTGSTTLVATFLSLGINNTGQAILAIALNQSNIGFTTLNFGAPSWSSFQTLISGSSTQGTPVAAVDQIGNGYIAYGRNDHVMVFTKVDLATGVPTDIPTGITNASNTAGDTVIAVAPSGYTVLVYGSNDSKEVTYSAYLPAGSTTFTVSSALSTNTSNRMEDFQVALDSQGNAVILWEEFNTGNNIIHGSTLPFQSTWTPQVDLTPIGDVTSPKLAILPSGIAYAIWALNSGSGNTIQYATLQPGQTTWSTPVNLFTPVTDTVSLPSIGVDLSGDLIAIWAQGTAPTMTVQYATKLLNGDWSVPGTVPFSPTSINALSLAVSAENRVTITLDQANGNPNDNMVFAIFADFPFTSLTPAAPTNFSGKQVRNRFLNVTEYQNTLTWTPSSSQNVATQVADYVLYRGNKQIAIIPAAGPYTYVDHYGRREATYTLFAQGENGLLSSPVVFNFPK